jgi:hypothetical protein
MTPTREQTECSHDQLQSWHFEDGTGPVGMWSCKACGLKFVPITETESARAQALEDAAGVCKAEQLTDDTGHPQDIGYMQAIGDCVRVIMALKGKQ